MKRSVFHKLFVLGMFSLSACTWSGGGSVSYADEESADVGTEASDADTADGTSGEDAGVGELGTTLRVWLLSDVRPAPIYLDSVYIVRGQSEILPAHATIEYPDGTAEVAAEVLALPNVEGCAFYEGDDYRDYDLILLPVVTFDVRETPYLRVEFDSDLQAGDMLTIDTPYYRCGGDTVFIEIQAYVEEELDRGVFRSFPSSNLDHPIPLSPEGQ